MAATGAVGTVQAPVNWPARDQGNRATCVAFAAAACFEHSLRSGGGGDAAARPQPPPLSPQFLFWAAKTQANDPSPNTDGSFLRFARRALASHGVCHEADWAYDPNPIVGNVSHGVPPGVPSAGALASALAYRRPPSKAYRSTVTGPPAPGRTHARDIVALLNTGRAVGVSVEVFREPTSRVTNWTTGNARRYGIVTDPWAGMAATGEAHAVCVIGYVLDAAEPGGGVFIFRNSEGVADFARLAPDPAKSYVPAPGFGQMSAAHVDQHLWEFYAV